MNIQSDLTANAVENVINGKTSNFVLRNFLPANLQSSLSLARKCDELRRLATLK